MTNVIQFPGNADAAHARVGAALLAEPPPHTHAVQFYEEDEFLFDIVAQFLAAGLSLGDRLLVIATPAHREGFVERLSPYGAADAIRTGQLVLLDARETLSKFMVDDMPDPDLFHDMLARALTALKGDDDHGARIRAYGEMVDLLWRDGNSRAAIRLEELWNDAGHAHTFSLLCAYAMGNFYREGDASRFMEVCRTHSHVMPTESFTKLDDPHARLREISLLQQRARSLETEVQHRKELERALRDALRERSRVEDELRTSVKREKEARVGAEASDAFKEMFLGMLGHDLRNPLNTVLTTARMMLLRGDIPGEGQKRLGRIVSSGVRMERMIAQILDVTRARLGAGIAVKRSERDIVPLVSKIVEEIRAAHPSRTIDLHASGPCIADVDGDRFEQVASNLLGNAVAHGDPERPIRVDVGPCDGVPTLSVQNYGPPIPCAFMESLFDPFRRGNQPRGGADGLGLGLYISERIVSAHGGKIVVESSEATGTRFEAIFPRAR